MNEETIKNLAELVSWQREKLEKIEKICKEWLNTSWSCFNCRNNMDEKLEDILNIIRGE